MIFADSLPGFKPLLRLSTLPAHALCFVGAFLFHSGSMSCSAAASFDRQHRRNVATLTRFLADIGHSSGLLAGASGFLPRP